MTNSPNEDLFAPNHELTIDDLQLKAAKGSRRRRDYIDTDPSSREIVYLEKHTHKHTHKRKKHPILNILLLVLVCFLGMAITAVSTVVVMQDRGKTSLLPSKDVELTVPETVVDDPETDVVVTDDGRTVVYNGETYRFNDKRTNILCIGIDKASLGLEDDIVGTGGQADTLILLSIDTATGDMDALAISRDIVTDIDLFAEDGSFVGSERTQICLSYAYGDGREQSCETTVRAAERLLYGVPINTYFAIDLDSIGKLNDAIGGVEVTLQSDFRTQNGTIHPQGSTITLYGEDALWFVRARDTEQLASNNDRMARQQQYLTAFAAKALSATKSSLQVPLNLYSTVSDDSITSLTPSKITFLTTKLVQRNPTLAFSSVPGTVSKSEDDGYAEYIVDDAKLYEQVLEIFYTKE